MYSGIDIFICHECKNTTIRSDISMRRIVYFNVADQTSAEGTFPATDCTYVFSCQSGLSQLTQYLCNPSRNYYGERCCLSQIYWLTQKAASIVTIGKTWSPLV